MKIFSLMSIFKDFCLYLINIVFREISSTPLSSVGQCCIVAADINHTNINKILRPTTPTSHNTAQPQENITENKNIFSISSHLPTKISAKTISTGRSPRSPPGSPWSGSAAYCRPGPHQRPPARQQHCQDKCAAQQVVACSQSPSRGGKILYLFF